MKVNSTTVKKLCNDPGGLAGTLLTNACKCSEQHIFVEGLIFVELKPSG